ncbi:MAG: elongation factor G [Clostridia bacterium]|nr:elongation factor G [Clostridia bacterium]
MKQYDANNILNVALAGHSGAGKTSLTEAMLYLAKATDRRGKVVDGNTVSDYDPEEISRKTSVSTAVAPFEWNGKKVNLLDAPGLFDFEGGVCEAARAADSMIIVLSGKDGVLVGTEKADTAANKRKLAKVFFVNGMTEEASHFYDVLRQIRELEKGAIPVVVPIYKGTSADIYANVLTNKAYDYSGGKPVEVPMPDLSDHMGEIMDEISEAVAETSEELMEKYFEGEPFTAEEIQEGVKAGIKDGSICPVFCGDAMLMRGLEEFMNGLTTLLPSAAEKAGEEAEDENGGKVTIEVDENAPVAALIFKTIADPFIGKLSYVKVLSGKLSSESQIVNMRTGESERISKVVLMSGKKQIDAPYIAAGDIGAIPKLTASVTGDTLAATSRKVKLAGIEYPYPPLSMAIVPAKKGEEDKIAQGIGRLVEEDPTIRFATDPETHEMILSGLGEQHLDVISSKLKSKFGVEVSLQQPKVAYRETIKKKVSVQGRHKKQSGGHGQFGDVWIEFEPKEGEDFEFGERVVGGAVPKNFFPAVEKGLREAINKGTLAGFPVVGLRATLYDGSYHPVDSSEMAFKTAASLAFKAGIPQANPVLLEPYGTLKVLVPSANMGDIMGEVSKRRGRVLGMNPAENGYQIIEAEAPFAEMYDFSTFVRQATQGRGSYTFEFVRYEEAPANVTQKVIEEYKSDEE